MVNIEKISEDEYRISVDSKFISFNKEKFEDLYYAVPVEEAIFLRLLLDNVCQSNEEIKFINEEVADKGALNELQEKIQAMSV